MANFIESFVDLFYQVDERFNKISHNLPPYLLKIL